MPAPVSVPDSARPPSDCAPARLALPPLATASMAVGASTCGPSNDSVPPALTCKLGEARLPETASVPALTVVAPV